MLMMTMTMTIIIIKSPNRRHTHGVEHNVSDAPITEHQKLDVLSVDTRLSFHLFVCFSLSALLKATKRDRQKV